MKEHALKKIVLYGDSNTYGYDARGILDRRFPPEHRWADLLAASGKWDVRPYGMNGRQIPQNDADYAWLHQILLNTEPYDLFCIMLGTNDLLFQTDPHMDIVTNRMDRLLAYLTSQKDGSLQSVPEAAGERILLLGPAPFVMTEGWYSDHNTVSASFDAEYRKLAEKYHTHYANVGSWKLPIAYDGIHFTEQAHHIFAQKLDQVISGIFPDITRQQTSPDPQEL